MKEKPYNIGNIVRFIYSLDKVFHVGRITEMSSSHYTIENKYFGWIAVSFKEVDGLASDKEASEFIAEELKDELVEKKKKDKNGMVTEWWINGGVPRPKRGFSKAKKKA